MGKQGNEPRAGVVVNGVRVAGRDSVMAPTTRRSQGHPRLATSRRLPVEEETSLQRTTRTRREVARSHGGVTKRCAEPGDPGDQGPR